MTARQQRLAYAPATTAGAGRRPLALSGVAFALLMLFGWFLSGGDAPDYNAADSAWTDWAGANRMTSGLGGSLILFAGVALLLFAGTIRSVLGAAERTISPDAQLSRVAFAGALLGAAGISMAIVMVGAATSEGASAHPLVSKAVVTASAGPYLVAAMGFATLLGCAGLLTLRSGAFPRWTAFVALIGAGAFLVTFPTLVAGAGKDTAFGYGFLPGVLCLVIWSMATSIAGYRADTSIAFSQPIPATATAARNSPEPRDTHLGRIGHDR